MTWNFMPGQKVVLVDDSPREVGIPRELGLVSGVKYPTKDSIYTVRMTYLSKEGRAALLLNEIDNESVSIKFGFDKEVGFEADRFRPVVQKKTDISIFRDMLNPHEQKVPA